MQKDIEIIERGVVEYSKAWSEQVGYFDELLANKRFGVTASSTTESTTSPLRSKCGVIMLCEHPHVYTLGKSGHENNLLVNDDFLKTIGATYFKTDRGGDITYHGYGQLVGYPILDIEQLGLSLKEYIYMVEQAIIMTLTHWGIESGRLDGATGVWLDGSRKICAIGVKASRYVTMHGFALNINTDLKYFSYINPCGFIDKGVTSMEKELGHKVDFKQVEHQFVTNFLSLLKD